MISAIYNLFRPFCFSRDRATVSSQEILGKKTKHAIDVRDATGSRSATTMDGKIDAFQKVMEGTVGGHHKKS